MSADERPASLGERMRRALRVRDQLLTSADADEGTAAREIAAPLVLRDPGLGSADDVRDVVLDLLSGRRESAPSGLLRALATFFDVAPDYFGDDAAAARRAEERLLESQLRRLGTRSVTLCRVPDGTGRGAALAFALDVVRAAAAEPPDGRPEEPR